MPFHIFVTPSRRPQTYAPPVDAVRASGLTKRYEALTAVDGLDIDVAPGEVRGLLGPNGAGKTTLLRMLFGLIRPDAGSVELLGHDFDGLGGEALEGVGGFVEEPSFYPYLSGAANLSVLAQLDGGHTEDAVDAVLERVGLGDRGDDRVAGYSTGMKQRLGLAAALLRSPACCCSTSRPPASTRRAPAPSPRSSASSPPRASPSSSQATRSVSSSASATPTR